MLVCASVGLFCPPAQLGGSLALSSSPQPHSGARCQRQKPWLPESEATETRPPAPAPAQPFLSADPSEHIDGVGGQSKRGRAMERGEDLKKKQRDGERRCGGEGEAEAGIGTWKLEQTEVLSPKRSTNREKRSKGWHGRGQGGQQWGHSGKGTCLQTEVLGCGGQSVGHTAPEPAPSSPGRG